MGVGGASPARGELRNGRGRVDDSRERRRLDAVHDGRLVAHDQNLSPTATIAARDVSSSIWDDGTITLSDGAPTRDWGVVAAGVVMLQPALNEAG